MMEQPASDRQIQLIGATCATSLAVPRQPEQPASGRQSLAMAPAAQPSGMALRRPGLPASAPQIHVSGRVAPPWRTCRSIFWVVFHRQSTPGVSAVSGGSPISSPVSRKGHVGFDTANDRLEGSHCRCHREFLARARMAFAVVMSAWRIEVHIRRHLGVGNVKVFLVRRQGFPQSTVWRVIRIPPSQAVRRGPKVPATRQS